MRPYNISVSYLVMFLSLIPTIILSQPASAEEKADLAKAPQNPVSDMISLPFQNNTNFGVGPD